jgi:transcription elongation factor GreA
MERIPMTAEGHAALQAELKNLKSVERPNIIAAIAEARAHGDLSENAEYHAAKEKQSFIEGRISELDDKLARADVIDVSKLTGGKIRFGATVSLIDVDSEEESSYKIVGDDEANVKEGKISISSPIARALIGKEEGDEAEVAAHLPGRAPTKSSKSSICKCQGRDRSDPQSGRSLTVAQATLPRCAQSFRHWAKHAAG